MIRNIIPYRKSIQERPIKEAEGWYKVQTFLCDVSCRLSTEGLVWCSRLVAGGEWVEIQLGGVLTGGGRLVSGAEPPRPVPSHPVPFRSRKWPEQMRVIDRK